MGGAQLSSAALRGHARLQSFDGWQDCLQKAQSHLGQFAFGCQWNGRPDYRGQW